MIIENSKIYSLTDVENLFFRPAFCGKAAEDLGVRVLYNMPLPTKVPVFSHNNDILKPFSSGWQGGSAKNLNQKEIPMAKLKAESSYSAEDYFSTIYEMITNSAAVSLGDLSGTDLEAAETELFRRALTESIYIHTWFGDEDGEVSDNTCVNGFIKHFITSKNDNGYDVPLEVYNDEQEMPIEDIFKSAWRVAGDAIHALAPEGNLAFFVSSDIYDAYFFYLEEQGLIDMNGEGANGRPTLNYHGIPLVEIPRSGTTLNSGKSFCVLTDRRNLVLALNTSDSPEKEIRMWYNPDEMENRQRVVFLIGTALVDDTLLAGFVYNAGVSLI
jgi:hypothetical protein